MSAKNLIMWWYMLKSYITSAIIVRLLYYIILDIKWSNMHLCTHKMYLYVVVRVVCCPTITTSVVCLCKNHTIYFTWRQVAVYYNVEIWKNTTWMPKDLICIVTCEQQSLYLFWIKLVDSNNNNYCFHHLSFFLACHKIQLGFRDRL